MGMINMLMMLVFMLMSTINIYATDDTMVVELDLNTALKKAQAVSLNVLLADARVEESMARLGQSRAALLPHVSGAIAWERQTKDLRSSGLQFPGQGTSLGPFNSFDARGRITQTIFDAAVLERLRAARLGTILSTLQAEKAKEDALALTATLYIQAKRAKESVATVAAALKRDYLAYQIQQTKFSQGTGSSLGVAQAKAAYAHSRYLYQMAKTDALEKRLDLGALLKIPRDTRIVFNEHRYNGILGKKRLTDAPVKFFALETAQAQLNVQESQARAAALDFGPRINLFGDYGRAGTSPDRGSNTYAFGLQATIPIWEGGIKSANLKEANAVLKETKASLDDAGYQADNSIVNAGAKLKEAWYLVIAQMANVALAQEEVQVIKQRVASGLANALDIADAKARYSHVMDDYKEAVASYWMSTIQLAHARGQMGFFIKN